MTPAWAAHLPPGMTPADAQDQLTREGTLPAAWLRRFAERPDAPIIHTSSSGWLTARQLLERAERKIALLGHHRRVLMSAAPSVDLVAFHIAALAHGITVVPANTAYTATELDHVATDSGATLAVLDDPTRGSGLPHVDVRDDDGPVPIEDHATPEAPALLCYTSGTTGKPKGALLTHRNLLASAESVRIAWRWSADDRLVLALPLFHMHGLGVGVHGTLLAGSSMVLLDRFDVDAVLEAVTEQTATMFFGVPTMYARLAGSPNVAAMKGLRLCVSGSAPLPADLHARFAETTGQRILERYGMTETCMNVSNPYDGDRRPGTVGIPLPGVELHLGHANEILVRGPSVFGGYLHGEPREPETFFATGDVGELDADGYLRIVGRTKELIITGGYNVYPREVEEAIASHPAVAEAAVVGIPDEEWGERVIAFVVGSATPDELDAHLRDRLASYKRPRAIHFVDALPRNALGKVDRRALSLESPGPTQ